MLANHLSNNGFGGGPRMIAVGSRPSRAFSVTDEVRHSDAPIVGAESVASSVTDKLSCLGVQAVRLRSRCTRTEGCEK